MEPQQSDQLKNWTATLALKLTAEKTNKKFNLLTKPEFKCVMCKKDIVSSPVFQCQLGHLACSRCSHLGRNCTLCGNSISRIKNVAIGAIIDSLYVTCKYKTLGCKKSCDFKSYLDHEKTCSFRPISCPMPDCTKVGVTNSLEQHLKSKHNISALQNLSSYSYSPSASFSLDSIPTKMLFMHSGNEDFYLLHQVKTDSGDRLHLISLKDSCKLTNYEINVEIKSSPKVNVEIKTCFKFKSNTTDQGLLIPKQDQLGTGGAPFKSKICTIRFFQNKLPV